MNTQNIKNGDVIYCCDDEFEVVDYASDCNDKGCFAAACGVWFDWSDVKLLLTKEEFLNKIK